MISVGFLLASSREPLRTVAGQAQRYLASEFGLEAGIVEAPFALDDGPGSFLELEGAAPGTLVLQAPPATGRALLHLTMGGGYAPEEEAALLREMLNEMPNVVTGNVTQAFAVAGLPVRLRPPFTAVCDCQRMAAPGTERLCATRLLRTAAGDFRFSFAPPGTLLMLDKEH